MKHLKFLAAVCCMLAVFTACEKNEPSDNTNGNGINTDQNGGNSNTGSDNATGNNNHAYVDLGLPSGLKWATCNVGATKPEEYGDYFAWGETEPKTTYDWNTYKWATATYGVEYDRWYLETLTKYNIYRGLGTVDNKTVLELADDAARANWGGAWRMPTDGEWEELFDNSTRTWTDDYNGTGVAGRIVTGLNGNAIFLPAAGYRGGDSDNAGYGYYWSSSLYTVYPDGAWTVYFTSDYDSSSDRDRCCGRSVRPVL